MPLTRLASRLARSHRLWRQPQRQLAGYWHEPLQLRACANTGEGPAEEDADIPPEVSELFQTLRGEALRRLDEFGPIHLFSLCWAYSTARLMDDELQQQVTRAALRLGKARDLEARNKRSAAGSISTSEASSSIEARGLEGPKTSQQPFVAEQAEHWMAIYKPAHWQVSVDSKEATKMAAVTPFEDEEGEGEEESPQERPKLHSWIRQHLAPEFPICNDATEAFGLLHRLDAQTSGMLVCAKSYVGAYWIRLQWCSYAVDKEYVCLVHGWVDPSQREIHKRIRIDKRKAPNSRRTISTHCTVGANGKPSFTELYTLAHLRRPLARHPEADGNVEDAEGERYSLVVLKLHTGRTHQIRVHMQSIGHPLVTDSKYAEDKHSADKVWCSRNFLHTYRLAFRDVPSSEELDESGHGSIRELCCPLPEDLRSSLSSLEAIDEVSKQHMGDWLDGNSSRLRPFQAYLETESDSSQPQPVSTQECTGTPSTS